MMKGKTSTGFEFSLEDEAMDDYELLEVVSKIDTGDYTLVPSMIEMLLGKEQKEKLKDHIRNKNGKVSVKNMMEEVMEIFKESTPGKNS